MTETSTAACAPAGHAELLGVLRAAGQDLERTAAALRGQDAAAVEDLVLTLRAQAAVVVAGQVQELAAQVREIAEWEPSEEEALPPVRLSSQASRIAARLRFLAEGVERIERAAEIGI